MQSDPNCTYLGGSLYSDVPCLGEEGGFLYSEIQVEHV